MTHPAAPDEADVATQRIRSLWTERGALLGRTFDVPECPYDSTEILVLASRGRQVAYLPPELSRASDRPSLARIFPQMRCYAFLAGNSFVNDLDYVGWFDYETAIDAPMAGTDASEAGSMMEANGLRSLTLNEYAVASHDLHSVTGVHLDERSTWTRLGTRIDGRLVAARFDGGEIAHGLGEEEPAEGSLLVAHEMDPEDSTPVLGMRTSTVRQPLRLAPPGMVDHVGSAHDAHSLVSTSSSEFLPQAWRSITDAFLRHGFHNELGLSTVDYLQSLPRFSPQPIALRGRLDVPIIVETRIPWRRQVELSDLRLSFAMRTSEVVTRGDAPERRPSSPYATWCNDWGQRFPVPIAPAQALPRLAGDEMGAAITELVAMHFARPDLGLQGRFYDAIGSSMVGVVDSNPIGPPRDRFPSLYHWRGQAELGSNLKPLAFSMYRPLIRANAFNT